MRAKMTLLSFSSAAVIIGVLMFFAAFIISLIRGTPSVTSEAQSRNNFIVELDKSTERCMRCQLM